LANPAPQHRPDQAAFSEPLEHLVAQTKAVGDRLRCLVLRVLREESYGVLELCQILDTSQPALSHHLKILHGAGFLARRREGNRIFYRRASDIGELARALLAGIDDIALPTDLNRRVEQVHDERRRRCETFFIEHASEFRVNQARISESSVYAAGILELIDRDDLNPGTALEIGPGEGELLSALATRFQNVIGIDSASNMLERASESTAGLTNVRLLNRDFTQLPADHRFDVIVAAMVVHHLASPQSFFRQAARLLVPGGMLVVAELCSHDHEWAREACGDQWLGFEPQELNAWAENSGLNLADSQFHAQQNGFQIQIQSYRNSTTLQHD
jgi:ArsR family transcriptional regulator